ncbi:MAG TPA: hypothetical protein VIL55_06925, partial [Naasia sp.]
NGSALEAVGHRGEPEDYEPAKRVIALIRNGTTAGRDLRQALAIPPFGWPRDAVDGMLLTLSVAGVLGARLDHQDVDPRRLTQQQLPKTVFAVHSVRLTKAQELALRAFVKRMLPTAPSPGAADAGRALETVVALAERSTGEPPLPSLQLPEWFADLRRLSAGPEQAAAVAGRKNDLIELADDLERRAQRADARIRQWREASTLTAWADQAGAAGRTLVLRHAAILEHRQLLDEPDPVGPLLRELTELLRGVTGNGHERLTTARAAAMEELQAAPEFAGLEAATQTQLLERWELGPLPPQGLATHEQLTAALAASPPAEWDARIAMVDLQLGRARAAAAKLHSPQAVTVAIPGATLRSRGEAQAWLDQVSALVEHADAEQPVIVLPSRNSA